MSASSQLQALADQEAEICASPPYAWPATWPAAVERAYHLGRKLAFTDAARVAQTDPPTTKGSAS